MNDKRVNLLLVEDDAVDIRLAQRAFRAQPFIQQITVASDGQQALALLPG